MDRNRRKGLAPFLLMIPVPLTTVSAMQASDPKSVLDAHQERVVREAVYEGNPQLESPKKDFQSILVVPKPLADLYIAHPQAVTDLLLKIVEGASPKDSVLASGYALELLYGPGGGVVPIEHFDKATYDSTDKDWRATPRKHWMNKIRSKTKVERPGK